jgi:hypothetical protein
MLAFIAAALFVVAGGLAGANVRLGPLTPSVFLAAGLACLALQTAGVSAGLPVVKDRRR